MYCLLFLPVACCCYFECRIFVFRMQTVNDRICLVRSVDSGVQICTLYS